MALYSYAADAHIPLAALRIGVMYAEGDGVPTSDAEAIRWLRTDTRLRGAGAFQRVAQFTEAPEE